MSKRKSDDTGGHGANSGLLHATEELKRRNSTLEHLLHEQKDSRAVMLHMLEDLEGERRQIEQARREWVTAIDAVRDPIFVHDQELKIVRANRAYAERAGRDIREVIGKPFWQVFPKLDTPPTGCACVLNQSWESEEDLRLPSGEEFISRAYPIYDPEGRHLYSLHVLTDVTEKRKAGVEQHILSEAMRQTNEAVLVLDRDMRITYLNPAFYRLFGYAPGEILGQPIAVLSVTGQANGLQPPEVVRQLRESRQWRGEVQRLAKDGTAIPILLTASAITGVRGEITGYVGTYLDLREMKKQEKVRRESERWFRGVFSSMDEAIFVVTPDRVIANMNPAAARMFGYSLEEIKNQSTEMLHIGREQYLEFGERIRAAFARNETAQFEFQARRKNGEVFPTEHAVSLLKDDTGEPLGIVSVVRDITERRRSQVALAESEEKFRQISATAHDAIIMVNNDGVIDFWNAAAERIFGYTAAEAAGRDMHALLVPQHQQQVAHNGFEKFRETGQGNVIGKTLELTALRKDGSEFPIELSVASVKFQGRWTAVGLVRDITERQHAERTTHKLNRTLVLLSACNEALVRITEEEVLVQDICQLIVALGGYLRAWVGYAEHDAAKHIRIVAQSGEKPGVLESLGLTWADDEQGQHPSALVIRNNRPLVVQDVSREPGLAPWRDMMLERGIAALIVLPLAVNKQPLGVLNILAGQVDAFDPDEIKLLFELADDLSFGIGARRMSQERDVAVREQKRSLERLRESLVDTVTAITTTVEMRDPYTAGHERRVSELATAIAREIGLSNDQIEGIHFGGLIHDLGKIRVPAEILSKPGRLSKTEFELVAGHAQAGYDILKGIKFPWPIAQMVLQHHERLDGSGYPEGLKGEDIIIEARILAVADTVEAMASHRPYRPALGIDKALAEIEQQRGRFYDTAVVDACLKLFREGNFSFSVKLE